MEFWARYGVDRSTGQNVNDPVFYSTELDDVLESDYDYDSRNYRNVTLVAGEGEGADRVSVTVENPVEGEPQPLPPEPPATVEYTIILGIDPEGGGVATGGGTVQEGASVTVTAVPSSGYSEAADRDDYGRGSSYANRGKHYVRGHYSRDGGRDGMGGYSSRRDNRGRYSRDDGRSEMMEHLEMAMDTATDQDREIIKRFMRQLENA